jgi:superfamily II DNA or RNA helicase
MDISDFIGSYPLISDDDFYLRNSLKEEFRELSSDGTEELPRPVNGVRQPYKYQNIVSKLLSSLTTVDSQLIFHGLGTGKTLTSIYLAESILNNKFAKKDETRVLVVTPSHTLENNYKKELEDYSPHNYEERLKKYNFTTYGKLAKKLQSGEYEKLVKKYSNSVIIMDEIHNLYPAKLESKNKKCTNLRKKECKANSFCTWDQKYNTCRSTCNNLSINPCKDSKNCNWDSIDEICEKVSVTKEAQYKYIKRFLHIVSNSKKILLSGTPMIDKAYDILLVMGLLNPRINMNQKTFDGFFNSEGFIKKDKKRDLMAIFKGMVSYVKQPSIKGVNKLFMSETETGHISHRLYEVELSSYQSCVLLAYLINKFFQRSHKKTKLSNDIEARTDQEDIALAFFLKAMNISESEKEYINKYLKNDETYNLVKDNPIDDLIRTEKGSKQAIETLNKELKQFNFNKNFGINIQGSRICNFVFEAPELKDMYGEGAAGREFYYTEKKNKILYKNINPEKLNQLINQQSSKLFNNTRVMEKIDWQINRLKIHKKYLQSAKYSAKFNKCVDNITQAERGCHLVFCEDILTGIVLLSKLLIYKKFKNVKNPDTKNLHGGKNFAVFTSESASGYVQKVLAKFNDEKNWDGDQIKVLIISRSKSEGISVFHIKNVHILTPHYNYTPVEQAIGRAIRTSSHRIVKKQYLKRLCRENKIDDTGEIEILTKRLEENKIVFKPDIDVSVYLYTSVFPENFKNSFDNLDTPDEYKYGLSIEKDTRMKQVERLLKESATDCVFNKGINTINKKFDESRECEYQSCEFTCDGKKQVGGGIDYKTYIMSVLPFENISILSKIKKIFKSEFSLTIQKLNTMLPKVNNLLLVYTMNYIVYNRLLIVNKYGFKCYLNQENQTYFLSEDTTDETELDGYYVQEPSVNSSLSLKACTDHLQMINTPKIIQKLIDNPSLGLINRLHPLIKEFLITKPNTLIDRLDVKKINIEGKGVFEKINGVWKKEEKKDRINCELIKQSKIKKDTLFLITSKKGSGRRCNTMDKNELKKILSECFNKTVIPNNTDQICSLLKQEIEKQ